MRLGGYLIATACLLLASSPVALSQGKPTFQDTAPAIDPDLGSDTLKLLPSLAPVSSPCGNLRPGQLEVIFGSNGFVATKFPYIILSFGGAPRLVLDRDDKGELSISGSFSSSADGTMVSIENDIATVDTRTTFKVTNPSPSRLLVADLSGQVVLDAWFANPQTIVINGELYLKSSLVTAQDSGLRFNGGTFEANCMEAGGGNSNGIAIR